MKTLFTLALSLAAYSGYSQWTIHKVADDPFEKPYTICSNTANDDNLMMKMEYSDEKKVIYFYVTAGYVCEDKPLVQINGKINDVWTPIYSGNAAYVGKNKTVIISMDWKSTTWMETFLSATDIAIKINDGSCDNEQGMFSNLNAKKASESWNEQP